MGFGTFAAGGTAVLLATRVPVGVPAMTVVVAGLLTLISADQVYRPVHPGPHPILDGGGTALTGLYLAGLSLGSPWLAGATGLIKLGTEAGAALRRDSRPPRALTVPRLLLGLVLPGAAWIVSGAPLPTWVLLGAIAGEGLARAGFYLRLQVRSPARQARADLAHHTVRRSS